MKQPISGFSTRRKVFLWSALLGLFLLLFFLTSFSYLNPAQEGILGLVTRFHFEAMIVIALAGVAIGAIGIYFFSSELEKTTDSLKGNTDLLLSFLSNQEKEIVNFLVEKNGQAFQSDITKSPGMTRLKTHRLVTKLAERKIVTVNSYGKANLVTLSPVLLKAFNLNPGFNFENKEN